MEVIWEGPRRKPYVRRSRSAVKHDAIIPGKTKTGMTSAVEGPDGKNPVVHHDNHLGRPRHLRISSCRVFVGTHADLES